MVFKRNFNNNLRKRDYLWPFEVNLMKKNNTSGIGTYFDAKWRAFKPSTSFSVGLHPEYLVSHSTHATCPFMAASCRAVYPTQDFLFKFLIPWIFKNLQKKKPYYLVQTETKGPLKQQVRQLQKPHHDRLNKIRTLE